MPLRKKPIKPLLSSDSSNLVPAATAVEIVAPIPAPTHNPIDWTSIALALIAILPATTAAIVSAIISARTAYQIEAVADKVEVIHTATNSMKDELVAAAGREGRIEGAATEKAKAE